MLKFLRLLIFFLRGNMKYHISISCDSFSDAFAVPCRKAISPYGFVFTELVSQIDQEINELVAEQQKVDAQCAHYKSEIGELKRDIENSNRQKQVVTKALVKKVLLNFSDYTQLSLTSFLSICSCL